MVRVMICGSRSEEDIRMLLEEGADGIGLIVEVTQELPCNLKREEALRLRKIIPPLTSSILILTEGNLDRIKEIASLIKPSAVQLHGFNPPDLIREVKEAIPFGIIKAIHASGGELLEDGRLIEGFKKAGVDAFILDTFSEGKVGATGIRVDIELALKVKEIIYPLPLILAGGLNPLNVRETVERVKPYAVDVLSGVLTKGYLDREKVRRFIEEAKGAYRATR